MISKLFTMKEVCFIGNLGSGQGNCGGQTIKTEIISQEILRVYDRDLVKIINTNGGKKKLLYLILTIIWGTFISKNVIMMPAENGLKIITPVLALFNIFFSRKLHYVVVGGWLPFFLQKRPILSLCLKRFDFIYVETKAMKIRLEQQAFCNISVMPNFKNLKILERKNLECKTTPPFRFCTFSRVMKEKGIEYAVNAVKIVNETMKIRCELDIYGAVDVRQKEWFDKLKEKFPPYIKYKGCISFENSVDVLKDYYALLFPTFYEGEGFAGTLIDSFSAGVPAIATDWHYNAEILEKNKEGLLCNVCDENDLAEKIVEAVSAKNDWMKYKEFCIDKAAEYVPSKVINILLANLR